MISANLQGDVLFDCGNFSVAYRKILAEVLRYGYNEKNERTGKIVKALHGGVSFKVDLRTGRLPVCGMRRLWPKTAAAEVAWFLMGTRDITWIRSKCPIWDKFVEADGQTIEAAYGYRWREHFKRDQIVKALHALANNNSDRRIYISAWDPGSDGLGSQHQKNVPCPVGFTLSLVGGQLHSSLMLRSSDIFVGLPYDVMGHAIFMDVFVETLKTINDRPYELGSMHFTLAHPHLYDVHFGMAEEAMSKREAFEAPKISGQWTMDKVQDMPDAFVEDYARISREALWPNFNPKPEVVQ